MNRRCTTVAKSLPRQLQINTSNKEKQDQFNRFLTPYHSVEFYETNIREPDADEETVIRYKASQFYDTLVDDSSLSIEGADFRPTHIKNNLHKLNSLVGKRAVFRVFLGIRLKSDDTVYVFRQEQAGKIGVPEGKASGFRQYFYPDEFDTSLAERTADSVNPRLKACLDILEWKNYVKLEPLPTWAGPWQEE